LIKRLSIYVQWEDECKKHAPHLKVLRFHPPSQSNAKRPSLAQIMEADIVISSATFKWTHWFNEVKNDSVLFHRVVQDESHLFYSRSVSAECSKAIAILAARR